MPILKLTTPAPNTTFTIADDTTMPPVKFRTDGSGSHTWSWTMKWGTFSVSGTATSPGNEWDASAAIADIGGTLSVTVTAAGQSATIAVLIRGTNPTEALVTNYLAEKAESAGFDKILKQESRFRHFNAQGEPIKSFDNGYGMCQLTTPVPSFKQVWSWKRNIDGGLQLFAQKRNAAIAYLGQSGRSYTPDQLRRETVCRWNGGSYHVWEGNPAAWVRNGNILCDTATGNIGWDMTDAENAGKTEAQLRARDKGSYSAPPTAAAHWKYSGVCYADHVLGS
ncbi:MAG: hypothetical protein ABW321_01555 [Polyangiales bacterium]